MLQLLWKYLTVIIYLFPWVERSSRSQEDSCVDGASGLWRKVSSVFYQPTTGVFELHQQNTLLLPNLLLPLHPPSCTPPLHLWISAASREIWAPGLGTLVDQANPAHRRAAGLGKTAGSSRVTQTNEHFFSQTRLCVCARRSGTVLNVGGLC